MDRMYVGSVVIDVNDISKMRAFWQEALAYELAYEAEDDWVKLVDPNEKGVSVSLQLVPERRTEKNRLHLDLYASEPMREVERLEGLGAERVRGPEEGRDFVVLADPEDGDPELILIATGSEVALAVEAHEELIADGVRSRVVSLPSWSIFDRQPEDYREAVLPSTVAARVSIEEASTLGWDRYVGTRGRMIGMHTFGSSAPLKDVLGKFGFTPERVVETAREVLETTEAGVAT